MKDKKIEITMEQLAKAIAKAMSSGIVEITLKNEPILAIAFSCFGVEIAKALFGEDEEGQDEQN